MKRIITLILAIGLGIVIVACDPPTGGNGNGNPSQFEQPFSLSAVVVEIPAAISAGTGATASWVAARQATGDETLFDKVKGVYNPIRDIYNPLAETILGYADGALTWIDEVILSVETRMATLEADGEISGTSDDGLFTVHVGLESTDSTDTYTVRRWDRPDEASDDWAKTLHAVVDFDTAAETVSGTVYGTADPENDTNDPIEFSIEFDNSDADLGMVVTARAVNVEGNVTDSTDPNKPSRIWMTANASETGEVFNMAANIWYIDVDLVPVERTTDDTTDTEFSDGYMEAVTGETYADDGDYQANYVYRAVVETTSGDSGDESYGKVDLALVQAGYDGDGVANPTTAMFTDDAIGKGYEEAMRYWVLGEYLTEINDALNLLSYTGGDLTTSSTVAEVVAALEYIQENISSPNAIIEEILGIFDFVSGLVNPGYFDGTATEEDGFFTGTAEYPDTAPDWFANLDDNDFAFDIEVLPADMVPASDVADDEFYQDVVMPDADEAPTHLD